jgi:hypothetical protein
MANLQKTLDALQPYVIGIRYLEGTPVIDVVFKTGWTLLESENIEKIKGDSELNYYMFLSKKENFGLDELLEYVDLTIKANIEREKKHELLKMKVNELKEFFKNHSLNKLKQLKFSFIDDELIPEIEDFNLDLDDAINTTSEYVKPSETTIIHPSEENVDELEKELEEEELRAKNFMRIQEEKKNTKRLNTKIELPPKKTLQNSLVYNDNENDDECECGPDEACSKCIDNKGL